MITLERSVAYDYRFDREKPRPVPYLARQLETFLGERLSVLLSKNRYQIKNGILYGEYMEEPFIDVMRRGVEHRRKIDGDQRPDREREEAEIEGFSRVEEIMRHPSTPLGTMMISVSPVGEGRSIYKHNYYDIFTLKAKEGKRFVEAWRYSSALSKVESQEKLSLFYPNLYGKEVKATDAYFLSHPVAVVNPLIQTPQELHAYLHRNHTVTNQEDFQKVWLACQPFVDHYIENPSEWSLNALMNKADLVAGLITVRSNILTFGEEIAFLGSQPVRFVATDCGFSGSASSPYSVADLGLRDLLGNRKFSCPDCGWMNIRPVNQKIPQCQHCRSRKVAC